MELLRARLLLLTRTSTCFPPVSHPTSTNTNTAASGLQECIIEFPVAEDACRTVHQHLLVLGSMDRSCHHGSPEAAVIDVLLKALHDPPPYALSTCTNRLQTQITTMRLSSGVSTTSTCSSVAILLGLFGLRCASFPIIAARQERPAPNDTSAWCNYELDWNDPANPVMVWEGM